MRTWLGGLISALSGAIVTALTTMVVAPESFNFDAGLNKVIIVSAFSAIVALLNYLKQSPLPPDRSGSGAKTLAAALVLLFLVAGCAGPQINGSPFAASSIGKIDMANAAETRQLAKDLISTWRLNSGFIRGSLGPKLQELPASVVMAMDELDKLALKEHPDDFDLGYGLGLRVRMLGALVTEALKLYAPDILSALPKVLAF